MKRVEVELETRHEDERGQPKKPGDCQNRATVTLDVGFGGQSGYWSPAFIERVFPARERTHSRTQQIMF